MIGHQHYDVITWKNCLYYCFCEHYSDIIMSVIASQTTSLAIVYSTVYSGADHRKHQSSASLAFVMGIHRRPVNSPHKWPVTRKMFPFHDVIMDNPLPNGRDRLAPHKHPVTQAWILSFMLAWTSCCTKSRVPGYDRRHGADMTLQ